MSLVRGGSRYGREAYEVKRAVSAGRLNGASDVEVAGASSEPVACEQEVSLPELLAMTVDEARGSVAGLRSVKTKLDVLHNLGLGYLTLRRGDAGAFGGEAQRLEACGGELTRSQDNALFVFDEPTIGLHPLDVEVLLDVLQRLVDAGATVVVIEHDLDMITNADYVIDLGPGGGEDGGEVVVCGTPEEVASCERSVTGAISKRNLSPSVLVRSAAFGACMQVGRAGEPVWARCLACGCGGPEGGFGPAAVRRASRDSLAPSTACSNFEPLVLRILI